MKTHAELVLMAAGWLKRQGYATVVTEPGYVNESPDAIGWNSRGQSCVVECKVSRADFFRDSLKPQHTQPHRAAALMGRRRYYLTPLGLVDLDDVRDPYGLLDVCPKA